MTSLVRFSSFLLTMLLMVCSYNGYGQNRSFDDVAKWLEVYGSRSIDTTIISKDKAKKFQLNASISFKLSTKEKTLEVQINEEIKTFGWSTSYVEVWEPIQTVQTALSQKVKIKSIYNNSWNNDELTVENGALKLIYSVGTKSKKLKSDRIFLRPVAIEFKEYGAFFKNMSPVKKAIYELVKFENGKTLLNKDAFK